MSPGFKALFLHLALLLVFLPGLLYAESPRLILQEAPDDLKLGKYVEYLEDPGAELKFSSIQKSRGWRTSPDEYISLGFSDAAVWFRIRLENKSGANLSLFLQENYPLLDDLRFFLPEGDAGYKEFQSGDKLPFSVRMIQHRSFLMPIHLAAGEVITIYIRMESSSSLRSNLHLISWKGLYRQIAYEDPYMWMYFGFLCVIFIYNLILYLSIRDLAYLYYILYLLGFLFIQFISNGYAYQYLWPETPGQSEILMRILVPLIMAFFILFLQAFIGIKRYYKGLDRFNSFLALMLIALGALCFFANHQLYWNLFLSLIGLLGVYFFPVIGFLIYKKSKEAIFVAVAFSFFTPAILLMVLDMLSIIPASSVSRYGLLLGSVAEITLLSLALAYRVNEAQKNQVKSETRFKHLIKNVNDIIFTLDKSLLITSLNPAVYKELGFDDSELLGSYFPDLAYEEPSDRNHKTRQFVMESCRSLSGEKLRSSFKAFINTRFKPEPVNMRVELELIPVAGASQILVRMSPVVEGFLIESLANEKQVYEIRNSFNDVEFLSSRLTSRLSRRLKEEDVLSIRLALREALFNAIEYGNLELDFDVKSKATRAGNYIELIRERVRDPRFDDRKVRVEYILARESVSYRILDEGAGFDYEAVLAELDAAGPEAAGGLWSMRKVFDVVEFKGKGNEILLVKNLT